MHNNGSMRIDLYTKAVLTIIAVMLAVIASNQLVSPRIASAQGGFAGVQWNGSDGFFDSRTGEIWVYNTETHTPILRYRLPNPGQPAR
jgi:hypothetical protein